MIALMYHDVVAPGRDDHSGFPGVDCARGANDTYGDMKNTRWSGIGNGAPPPIASAAPNPGIAAASTVPAMTPGLQ